jgi:hypothetical protein
VDVIPAAVPVSATTLARRLDGTDDPMPNVLSARHLARIGRGLFYVASSNVPWATLLARTFEVDVKACARCAGRLEVRAVVTEAAIKAKTVTNIYPLEILGDRIRALGDFGKRADLVSEIEAFLRERKNERGAVVAAYLLTL